MHKHKPDARQLAREKLVFRYSSALERGDFDTAAEILRQAERDPILEQMIWELHEALRAETQAAPSLYQNGKHTGKEGLMTTTTYRAPTHATTRPIATRYRWSWATLAAAVIALTLFSGLLLSGRNFTDPEQDNLLALQGGTNTPTSTPFATFTPTLTLTPTSTPAPIMDMTICQVFNSGPDGLDVRTSPTADSDFVGTLPLNMSADVIRMQANPDDGYTWYLIAFLSDGDTIGGWVRQDTVSEMSDCHEPGINLGNAVASVVPSEVPVIAATPPYLCQVINNSPLAVSIQSEPTERSEQAGVLLPDAQVRVARTEHNVSDNQLWYLITFPTDDAGVMGWIRADAVTQVTGCPSGTDSASDHVPPTVVPTVPNPNASGVCMAFVNLAEGVNALSRPSELGVSLGHFPLGAVVDIIDQASSLELGISWTFVSGQVDGRRVQGWVRGSDLSPYGDTACPPSPDIQAMQATSEAMGIQPISREMALTLTAMPTCPPEVVGLPSTFTPTPFVTQHPFQGDPTQVPSSGAPTFTPTPSPFAPEGVFLTATVAVQQATEAARVQQTMGDLGTPTATPFPFDAIHATVTAAVAQASQPPPTVPPPGMYPCGSFNASWTPTPAGTPTPRLAFTMWNSVILLQAVENIPANTPVRIRSGYFNGEEWVYEVETLDASTMGMARESQLGIVFPVNVTPTAGFDAQLRTGAILLTTEWVSEIPPGARVQIGSAYYTGSEWIYNVTMENGNTSAEAREWQLTPAPNFIPGGAMPEPTSPPLATFVPTPTPLASPTPTPGR